MKNPGLDKERHESSSDDEFGIETREWLDSFDAVLERNGMARAAALLGELSAHAHARGIRSKFSANTPYINTISAKDQGAFPGSREIERRIKSIIRWNAMAMVVRANRKEEGIGGHISTYASVATLFEVGFNHFFRGPHHECCGDQVYFQGHASPGVYARAFLEGRLSVEDLSNFRHEAHHDRGLPSYPHPWLMPDFWQFATVSMGLGPLMAIYQARMNRYLEDRGLKRTANDKIWCFIGDGETDEPETLGAISLAARESLDNLIFVINCNLQRLDGPVRGNGNIIQELETIFRGAGWNVIKVLLGGDWDALLAADQSGLLIKRLGEIVDGERQNFVVRGGHYIREHFFGVYPELTGLVKHLSDEQLERLRLGGHDPEKVFTAYKAAVEHRGSPTVILARTIKGYGLGEAGEGKNITHQQKQMNEDELREFRSRFGIPVSDAELADIPFYRPADDSPEMVYLRERRKALGGFIPSRRTENGPIIMPDNSIFEEFFRGSQGHSVATTMAFVRLLGKLLRDKDIGHLIVPIVPDEARTFGMEALFRQVGIYSHVGQLYEPVDHEHLLYYKEARNGQILEEGITEAGSMASFIAAGTAWSTHAVNTIPFFIYYSMFGFQRIGDLIWAAADMRTRGFLVGATAGRTTLAGEGLQHQDGHSHLLAYPIPTLRAYDPAFAYEIAVIIREGLKRMYVDQESVFYYLTVMNEPYPQPVKPDDVEEGILKGMYLLKKPLDDNVAPPVHLFGSGAILTQVIQAQQLLHDRYNINADVWSVTSYKELYRNAIMTERENLIHPGKTPLKTWLNTALGNASGVFVAVSDYVRALPESIGRWVPGQFLTLGTDGFGRSDGRKHLREFFEINDRWIVFAALSGLARHGSLPISSLTQAMKELDLERDHEKLW